MSIIELAQNLRSGVDLPYDLCSARRSQSWEFSVCCYL